MTTARSGSWPSPRRCRRRCSVCPDAGPEGLRRPAGGGGLMTDTTAIQDRIRGAVPPVPAAHHGGARCPASPPPDTEMPWRLSWKCWSRRPRTAGSGASAGCAPPLGCRQARPGRPSSTTGCPWRCDGNWTSWPTAASSTAASTCWPSDCRAPARPTPCAPSATGWWSRAGRCSSPRPTGWCRTSSPPSGTWPCRDNCASSTVTTSCSSTTSATCPRAPRG